MATATMVQECKPVVAIVVVQCIYAGMALFTKAALTSGLHPMVFVVYRQAVAAVFLVPTSILSRGGRMGHLALNCKGFWLVFLTALVGATFNQCFYYQGLKRTTSSMAVAMINLVPAVTFFMAASIGLEKMKLRSIRSMAKVFGTVVCFGGAVSMVLFQGKKLSAMESSPITTVLHSSRENMVMGFLFLTGSMFFWSLWLILQVPICKNYLDPLSLAAWTSFLSTFQSAILTFFLEPDFRYWKIRSLPQLLCCLYAAIFGTGVNLYLQSWCIAARGPLFCAIFNPLTTVITTILALVFLHEELHLCSLLGAIAVICGLYIVLWGKAKDFQMKNAGSNRADDEDAAENSISNGRNGCEDAMKEPLLSDIEK